MNSIYFTFVDDRAKIAYSCNISKGHITDTCYDLRSTRDINYRSGDLVFVPLGVKFDMGVEFCAYLYSRSSMPKKKGLIIANGVGVIDNGYKDEVAIMFYAIKDGKIAFGERVGQIVFEKRSDVELIMVERLVEENNRGGGFGSTGEI